MQRLRVCCEINQHNKSSIVISLLLLSLLLLMYRIYCQGQCNMGARVAIAYPPQAPPTHKFLIGGGGVVNLPFHLPTASRPSITMNGYGRCSLVTLSFFL